MSSDPIHEDLRARLVTDCGRCFALCCVATTFQASPEFAADKDAHTACPQLGADHRCTVHSALVDRGYAGCVIYDCRGAGVVVSQQTFAGRDWRTHPDEATAMFEAFLVVRVLHEQLELLLGARDLPLPADVVADIDALITTVSTASLLPSSSLHHGLADRLRAETTAMLRRLAPHLSSLSSSRAVRSSLVQISKRSS